MAPFEPNPNTRTVRASVMDLASLFNEPASRLSTLPDELIGIVADMLYVPDESEGGWISRKTNWSLQWGHIMRPHYWRMAESRKRKREP